MRKFIHNKKCIIVSLLLILTISNFSMAFAYWASGISGDQSYSDLSILLGEWNFEDTELVVANFRSDHAVVLALTPETVTTNNKAGVEEALAAYGLLSEEAKAELSAEQALLISLLNEIIALENSEFLDFEAYPYDSGLTGTIDMNGRTWFAEDVFISNDSNYDVWNDTRSLALRSTAYFESQDLFINGIDKIKIYHGALNFNDGTSYQFKVEYELDSNPGVWLTLQDGGTDLLIDVISATPLTYTEIDVDITEALNIRFTPVIENASGYINLDDITIYEHIVSSELEVTTFRTIYAGALALEVTSVETTDKAAVQQALAAYELLSVEAKAELTSEKALLDSLLIEINLQEDIEAAEALVVIAENSKQQTDVDSAQVLVSALASGIEKTALQARIDQVQSLMDDLANYRSDHSTALALSVGTVSPSDQSIVEAALAAYESLSIEAKAELTSEKALLDSLLVEINNQIPTSTQVAQFRSNHAVVLALTTETVLISDKAGVETALAVYELLSEDAKAELTSEKALLDSLLVEIYLQEDIEAAEAVDDLITALPSAGEIILSNQSQIEAARNAYNALTPSQQSLVVNEGLLLSVESELAALQTATTSVTIAENSNLQTDVDSAQVLVSALTNGPAKTSLQARLDAVQDIIDVETARQLLISYFDLNSVVVKKFNNATAIKETAFLSKANETVAGLDVIITVTNTDEVDRRNTTYTIDITKNGASVTIDVDVSFTR